MFTGEVMEVGLNKYIPRCAPALERGDFLLLPPQLPIFINFQRTVAFAHTKNMGVFTCVRCLVVGQQLLEVHILLFLDFFQEGARYGRGEEGASTHALPSMVRIPRIVNIVHTLLL